ncbi:MAG: sulfatase [Deltaproteobacteria bacterium HGW-Deltaproteobacteria-22]|nr:MAG: sulfatase [Deltaproteobacteria bacterium HGW-Deltaproteobacteria-22]
MQFVTPAVMLFMMFLPRCEGRAPKLCAPAPADMQCVFGGEMIRGRDKGPRSQRPSARIWVDTYYMDTTEVTVKAFDACVAAGKCPFQKTNCKGFSDPEQPKVGVSWFAARAFCEAQGKRLPTEAEFEKAIRGPDGEWFAWGNDPPSCANTVYLAPKVGRGCGKTSPKEGTGATWPVKSRPAGRYGLYDISGNADEWTQDWYTYGGYAECGADCLGVNPKGPCGGADKCPGFVERVVKGGSWFWDPSHLPGYFRRPHFPDNKKIYHHFGFRCARDSVTPWDFVPILINEWVDGAARFSGLRMWWHPPVKRRK